jgi:hypothetical protein
MSLRDYKSLEEVPEKELLLYVLSSNLQILRQLDFLENHIKNKENVAPPSEIADDMIYKLPTFLDLLNEALEKRNGN